MEAPFVPPSLYTDEDMLLPAISTGMNFDKYGVIPVEVSDAHFRMSLTKFEEMNMGGSLGRPLARGNIRAAVERLNPVRDLDNAPGGLVVGAVSGATILERRKEGERVSSATKNDTPEETARTQTPKAAPEEVVSSVERKLT
ncbi:hypothetical protein MRX96_056013 [Rhipicephalus microplus]